MCLSHLEQYLFNMSIKPNGEITHHALTQTSLRTKMLTQYRMKFNNINFLSTLSQLGFNILAPKMLKLKHFVEVEDINVIKLHY